MKLFIRALLVIGITGMVLVAGGLILAIQFLETPPSKSEEKVVFEVQPGESFKTVAAHLEKQGLVTSAWKLELFVRIARSGSKIRVGEYEMQRNFRPREILQVLISGKSIEYQVTVPEGSNRFEIAEILEGTHLINRADFMALTTDKAFIQEVLGKDLPSLEGYLFPDTYNLTKYTGARALIKMMVDHFKESFKKVRGLDGWTLGELNENQLVTMASIIEKETGAPEERSVIASVFYNRLRLKMPLQTDPTVIYGLFLLNGKWNGVLPRAELQRPGPYNTYMNRGLPPGPISNPGFLALKAAGLPQKTEYLFFMSRNDGTHTFSKEYAQHTEAVKKYWREKNAGASKTSWRDLQKRDQVPDRVHEAPPPKIKN